MSLKLCLTRVHQKGSWAVRFVSQTWNINVIKYCIPVNANTQNKTCSEFSHTSSHNRLACYLLLSFSYIFLVFKDDLRVWSAASSRAAGEKRLPGRLHWLLPAFSRQAVCGEGLQVVPPRPLLWILCSGARPTWQTQHRAVERVR